MQALISTRALAHRASRMYGSVDRAADRLGVKPVQSVDGVHLYSERDAEMILREIEARELRTQTETSTAHGAIR